MLYDLSPHIILIPHQPLDTIRGPIRSVLDSHNTYIFPFCILFPRIFDIILPFKHAYYLRLPAAFDRSYVGVHLWPGHPDHFMGCSEVSRGG